MRKRTLVPVLALTASVVAVLVLVFGSASGQPGAVPGDHYLCYEAVDETVPPQNPPPVTLLDQFEQGLFDPGVADRLCTPASKLFEGAFFPVTDPVTHLKRYPITRQTPFQRRTVHVQNQFGHYVLRVISADWLLVPTTKGRDQEPPPPNPAAPGFEHYKCYKARQEPRVDDQFGSRRVAIWTAFLCTPVQKNEEPIRNPDRHLLCYKVPQTPFVANVLANNQFGLERLRLVKHREFCVPSKKTLVP